LNHAAIEVHIFPGQAQQLAQPHPGREGQDVEGLSSRAASKRARACSWISGRISCGWGLGAVTVAAKLRGTVDHPACQQRVKAAHTAPRQLRADKHHEFVPERFKDLSTPTLMLEGGDSPALVKAADKAVDETLPNCRNVVMPGQGHAAMDTETDLFTTEVVRFLTAD
jgi:pimeloyl-ACP methyl ester carboxylesterase